jgi:hypothetical protein
MTNCFVQLLRNLSQVWFQSNKLVTDDLKIEWYVNKNNTRTMVLLSRGGERFKSSIVCGGALVPGYVACYCGGETHKKLAG